MVTVVLPQPILAAAILFSTAVPQGTALNDESPGIGASRETRPGTGIAPDLEIDPLAVSQEMQAFIEERVPRDQSRLVRLLALQDAIFDPDHGLGVTYTSSATHTAAGTFLEGSGNCLSFTLLFVTLARHLGLAAYFVEVDEVTGWSQQGDVGLNHWHMYAEVEFDNGVVPVDFLPWSERRYRSSRRISDGRVRAHYHTNVGAEKLTGGDSRQALAHFRRALELDPSFNPARVNMAVAYRRSGQPDKAAAGLLEVLDAEPGNTVAAANLANLYLVEGREDDAKKWLARREAFLNRNPFHHFRLGMRALQADEPLEARKHFKRAINRQPDEAIFFEKLAAANFRLGEDGKARSNLRRALRLTDDPERRQLLEDRLGENSSRLPGSH